MLLRTRIMVLQALNELPLHRESDNSNNSVTYNRIALAHSVPLALKVAIQRMCTAVPKLLIILLLHGCMNGKSLSGMLNCTLSGKQHHHGQVKVGRNTRRGCYIHMAWCSCPQRSTIWHIISGMRSYACPCLFPFIRTRIVIVDIILWTLLLLWTILLFWTVLLFWTYMWTSLCFEMWDWWLLLLL